MRDMVFPLCYQVSLYVASRRHCSLTLHVMGWRATNLSKLSTVKHFEILSLTNRHDHCKALQHTLTGCTFTQERWFEHATAFAFGSSDCGMSTQEPSPAKRQPW